MIAKNESNTDIIQSILKITPSDSWCIEIFAIMPSDAKAVMHWIFSYISGKIIVIGS